MKTIILSLSILATGLIAFGQSDKYQMVMEQTIAQFNTARTANDFASLAAKFERIGETEKSQWLPYYYAAVCSIFQGFQDEKADKDALGNKADELIAKSEALESKNAEIVLLKAMSATLHMMVDPMSRWQKYGMLQREALESAKELDANNPRIYYWEGQNMMGTPKQFGGGKEVAKPIFEKALALYASFAPATNLHPSWGKEQTNQMLLKCNEE